MKNKLNDFSNNYNKKGTKINTLPKPIINLFFYIGLFSALAFRAIVIFEKINPLYARTAWYIGVIGYIIFFSYRYYITKKRLNVIKTNNLIQKVKQKNLSENDRETITYLLNSLTKSKEIINYKFIFITSLIAILFDILLTFSI